MPLRQLLLFFLVLAIGSIVAYADEPTPSKVSQNNVELQVSIASGAENGKAIVMLNAKLINRNTYTIGWVKGSAVQELLVTVSNPKKESPARTKEGYTQYYTFDRRLSKHELAAGNIIEWSINLSELFDLIPDKYTVTTTLWVNIPGPVFDLTINGLQFEVKKLIRAR